MRRQRRPSGAGHPVEGPPPRRRLMLVAVAALLPAVAGCEDRIWPESGRVVSQGTIDVGDLAIAYPVSGGRTDLYFRIRNRGEAADTLLRIDLGGLGTTSVVRPTGASADAIAMGGQAAWEPVGDLEIRRKDDIDLEPDDLHVLVERVPGQLILGDSVPVFLDFLTAGRVIGRALVLTRDEIDLLYGIERPES